MSAQLKPLNRKTAADQIPRETAVLAERVVQFGEGNFLRAFADWMIDRANRNGPATAVGRVVAVQPISHGMADIINSQDGLYHVCQRGVLNGVTIDRADLVASVSRCLDPYTNYCGLLQLARSPDVSIVISNTTEAGIAYVEEPQPVGCDAKCPASYPAKVAAYLYARFKAFAGSHESGMLFLPCELIEANGSKLLDCVLKHAAAWGLPAEFVAWVKNDCVFCNTLVDRIVPGYPKEEAPMWLSRLGFDDKILVATEPFALWVIETQQNPQELAARFHFEVDKVPGMNIIWTTDLRPHRTRKVKVLNGSHTSIVAASYLAGVDTVRESIEDPVVGKYLTKLLHGEILPGLTTPAAESRAYADAVWERFANPFIRHLLLSISLNSVSKWTVRVLPSVKDALAQKRHPRLLIHSLAALLAFYNGKPTASDAELQGVRFDGVAYPIKDNAPILATMAALWKQYEADKDVAALVKKAMSDKSLWNEDLTALGFVDDVVASLTSILKNGSRKAMEELIA